MEEEEEAWSDAIQVSLALPCQAAAGACVAGRAQK